VEHLRGEPGRRRGEDRDESAFERRRVALKGEGPAVGILCWARWPDSTPMKLSISMLIIGSGSLTSPGYGSRAPVPTRPWTALRSPTI
jgi:hypothetical protein